MKKIFIRLLVVGLAALMAGGLAGCAKEQPKGEEKTAAKGEKIRVGSKDFTEGLIVSEIYALALEDKGCQVERVFDIAGSLVHTSLINDEIDLYPEYTGTGLLTILGMDMMTDPQKVYDTVKAEYEKRFQVTWLDYSPANDGQGIVITREASDRLGIHTLTDLQAHAGEIRFASQGEFDERDDGLPAMNRVYGEFKWKSSRVYDGGLKYEVLSKGEADAAPAYTTEAQLSLKDQFVLLEDDKHVWPPYNLAPVVRDDCLKAHPEIADILNRVSAGLDTETLTSLNAKVDLDKEEYEDVAKEYYDSIKDSIDK